MTYVERGVVKSNRTIWRLRTIIDFFWAIINFISVFFATMFSVILITKIRLFKQPVKYFVVYALHLQMEKSDGYKKLSGSSKKWGGGGGPGGGPRGPPRGLDNVRGIDHNSLPACGSCCGG
ncbi:hypothetical protein R6Q57_015301 [Mikania cordata]